MYLKSGSLQSFNLVIVIRTVCKQYVKDLFLFTFAPHTVTEIWKCHLGALLHTLPVLTLNIPSNGLFYVSFCTF